MEEAKMEEAKMDKRLVQCPFCGHRDKVGGIGATYCGPHKVGDKYYKAYRMVEIEQQQDHSPKEVRDGR